MTKPAEWLGATRPRRELEDKGISRFERTLGISVLNVTIYEDRPEYCLSADIMSKLGWLGCELHLDMTNHPYSRWEAIQRNDEAFA